MTTFIEFKLHAKYKKGNIVFINPDHITAINEEKELDGTAITVNGTREIIVEDKLKDIITTINNGNY